MELMPLLVVDLSLLIIAFLARVAVSVKMVYLMNRAYAIPDISVDLEQKFQMIITCFVQLVFIVKQVLKSQGNVRKVNFRRQEQRPKQNVVIAFQVFTV